MDDIAARAAELGIETEYFDARGTQRIVPRETLTRLIAALAPPDRAVGGSDALLWRHARTSHLDVSALAGERGWAAHGEGGEVARGGRAEALRFERAISPGIHYLRPQHHGDARPDRASDIAHGIIVAPETAYQLDDIAAEKVWVLAVQLYGVRSRRNWGHGDFTDLMNLLRLVGDLGGAGIGLNPLHALFEDRAEQASPYAPNSRLFLNVLYIDVEAIPEFPGIAAARFADDIERLQATTMVDYGAVAALKVKALKLAYAGFRRSRNRQRRTALEKFRAERGRPLMQFAAFEVLRRRFSGPWWEWPAEWRQPTDASIESLRKRSPADFGYYEFIQWVADEQLTAVQAEARRRGMAVGLYVDIAVGMEPGGAEAWSAQDSIVPQVEVGAPPDLLNTAGQAWGVAAYNPRSLGTSAFAPMIALLSAAMRHAGALRLDHVLGLNRLYLIPFGCKPQEGAYVRYPLQPLLAVIALMSVRHRCLVIGEDLGTVPAELRGILADWGIWSYLVMLFERRDDGSFRRPDEYRRNALVTFSTHDLPTFEGWRIGHDLRVKRGVGLDPGETDDERAGAHWRLGEALAQCGICRDRMWTFDDAARFLARTPSRFLVVQIEDVLGLIDQPNVPGTVLEHPNWRRRLPVAVEGLADLAELKTVAGILMNEGRSQS